MIGFAYPKHPVEANELPLSHTPIQSITHKNKKCSPIKKPRRSGANTFKGVNVLLIRGVQRGKWGPSAARISCGGVYHKKTPAEARV